MYHKSFALHSECGFSKKKKCYPILSAPTHIKPIPKCKMN